MSTHHLRCLNTDIEYAFLNNVIYFNFRHVLRALEYKSPMKRALATKMGLLCLAEIDANFCWSDGHQEPAVPLVPLVHFLRSSRKLNSNVLRWHLFNNRTSPAYINTPEQSPEPEWKAAPMSVQPPSPAPWNDALQAPMSVPPPSPAPWNSSPSVPWSYPKLCRGSPASTVTEPSLSPPPVVPILLSRAPPPPVVPKIETSLLRRLQSIAQSLPPVVEPSLLRRLQSIAQFLPPAVPNVSTPSLPPDFEPRPALLTPKVSLSPPPDAYRFESQQPSQLDDSFEFQQSSQLDDSFEFQQPSSPDGSFEFQQSSQLDDSFEFQHSSQLDDSFQSQQPSQLDDSFEFQQPSSSDAYRFDSQPALLIPKVSHSPPPPSMTRQRSPLHSSLLRSLLSVAQTTDSVPSVARPKRSLSTPPAPVKRLLVSTQQFDGNPQRFVCTQVYFY